MGYLKSICVCNLPPWVLLQHMPLPRDTVALTAAYLLSRTMCRGENSILGQLKAEGKSCIPLCYGHRLLLLDRGIRSWDPPVAALGNLQQPGALQPQVMGSGSLKASLPPAKYKSGSKALSVAPGWAQLVLFTASKMHASCS